MSSIEVVANRLNIFSRIFQKLSKAVRMRLFSLSGKAGGRPSSVGCPAARVRWLTDAAGDRRAKVSGLSAADPCLI
jgi:hypothetical protein